MPEDKSGETSQSYAVSRQQISVLFVLTFLGMVAILVLFLILLSARPQGRLEARNTTLYDATISAAAEQLANYEEHEDGSVSIPIDRAIELIAQRGVLPQSKLDAPVSDEADVEADTVPEVVDTTTDDSVTDDSVIVSELSQEQREELAAALPDGSVVYNNCLACHQVDGLGIAGAFPPLVNHTPYLYNQTGGPDYLSNLILYGLQGEIQAEGMTYNGVMTPWASLSDEEIAAVLNYILTEWGNDQLVEDFMPYIAADVAEHRGKGWTGMDVYNLRQELGQAAEPMEETSDVPVEEAADTTADVPIEEAVDVSEDTDSGEADVASEVITETDTAEADVVTDEVQTDIVTNDEPVETSDAETVEVSDTAEEAGVSDEMMAIVASLPDGAGVYNNCIACHQATGQGIPGAFPPLVAHAPKLYNAEGGRAYLPQLILQGLQGEIQAEGMTYNGIMTPWASLTDEQIAAVLNYTLNAWGNDQLLDNFVPYIPADIAEARANPEDSYSLRQEIVLE